MKLNFQGSFDNYQIGSKV